MMTMNDLTHDPARALTTDPTSATAGARAVDAHDSALTISRRYFLAVAAVAVGVTMVSGASTAALAQATAEGVSRGADLGVDVRHAPFVCDDDAEVAMTTPPLLTSPPMPRSAECARARSGRAVPCACGRRASRRCGARASWLCSC